MDENANNANQDEVIVDGEVIEETVVTAEAEPQDGHLQVLLSLEELVKNYIDSIEKLTDELKKHRQMFVDGFDNNPTYREIEEKVKTEDKKRLELRQQILNQPAMRELAQKIKDMGTELREKKASLSDYLLEYQRLANTNEIEGKDGQIREIINSAKAVKRSSREEK